MKKIAIFGGSFNPIHNGHLQIIKKISNEKIVDEIWIMPCKKHSFDKNLASFKDRREMIRLAFERKKKIRICDFENKIHGKNYTIKTIKKLKKIHPNYKFFWVIGSDNLYTIKKWNRYKQLIKEIEFIVLKRKGYKLKRIRGVSMIVLGCFLENISSTLIRERIDQSKPLKNLVPLQVEKYIKKKGIYK
jgi:nicotinate-nucleotide adenylyltransferase